MSSRSRDKTKHLQYAPPIDIPKAIKQANDEPNWSETYPAVNVGISSTTPRYQTNNSTTSPCEAVPFRIRSRNSSNFCFSRPATGPSSELDRTIPTLHLYFRTTYFQITQLNIPKSPKRLLRPPPPSAPMGLPPKIGYKFLTVTSPVYEMPNNRKSNTSFLLRKIVNLNIPKLWSL